jgi:hypothetical protein
LYSECLTKEALDGLGEFNIGGQIIQTVKYEIGRWYGMEMNVEKTKVMRISRQSSPVTITIDQNQTENVDVLNLWVAC